MAWWLIKVETQGKLQRGVIEEHGNEFRLWSGFQAAWHQELPLTTPLHVLYRAPEVLNYWAVYPSLIYSISKGLSVRFLVK